MPKPMSPIDMIAIVGFARDPMVVILSFRWDDGPGINKPVSGSYEDCSCGLLIKVLSSLIDSPGWLEYQKLRSCKTRRDMKNSVRVPDAKG
jgi:hypothetical protein